MPAWVMDRAFDIVEANWLAKIVHQGMLASPYQPHNPIRFVLLDPAASLWTPDIDTQRVRLGATARYLAAAHATDPSVARLLRELSGVPEAAGDGAGAPTWTAMPHGTMRVAHPDAGLLTFGFELLNLPADDGLILNVQTPSPGTRTQAALDRLGGQATG